MSAKKKRKKSWLVLLLVQSQRGKRVRIHSFDKDRADVLAASDRGFCFEQEKLIVLDEEEQN